MPLKFPAHIYLFAFASAALVSCFSLPLWRRWANRVGLVDDPGHRKIHESPVPLAGGLAALTGLILPLLTAAIALFVFFRNETNSELLIHGFNRRGIELGAILLGAIGMVILGLLDDKHELKPAWKFFGQLVIATLVAASGVRITLFVPNVAFSYFVTILWILTVTNALNFLDNMNGLCAGLGVIASASFAFLAALDGQYLVASLGFLICGALMGFLPHNFPKATAFLGDSGSHLVGFICAVLAILPHFYTKTNPRPLAVLAPLVILAVPLFDLVSVVLIRWRAGKPFYVGDTNHISHRLVRSGLSPTKSVLLIWFVASLCAALAFFC